MARDSLQRQIAIEYEAARQWAIRSGNPFRHSDESGVWEIERIDVNRPVYRRTHNLSAAVTTRTDLLHVPGLFETPVTGQGMMLGIWDGGHVYAGHREFDGRVTFGDSAPLEDHATHVGGTLVASGILAASRGMAPDAGLKSWDWNADAVEMLEAAAAGLLVSNHSYGPTAGWTFADLEGTGAQWYWLGDSSVNPAEDYTFGYYGRDASRWDRVAWESPFLLPVLSAGNDRSDTGPAAGPYRVLDAVTGAYRDETMETRFIAPDGGTEGYDSIAGQAVAKNVLSIGSVEDVVPGSDLRPQVSRFSSYGPTDDGRIKPDLMCNGESLLSTAMGSVDAYRLSSGTSMAAANCSGSLILLQQLYLDQTGVPLRAATLKGLALHTARDLGSPGPDYKTGWGLLDAAEAARHLQSRLRNPVAVVEDRLEDSVPSAMALVKSEAGPVRLTLSWTDRPAEATNPGAAGHRLPLLLRDLDMRLEHPESGETWFPWVLDPERPAGAATFGDNQVDPVEQIRIDEAPGGNYVLHVSVDRAPGAEGPVPFSLLVTGLTDRSRFVSVPALETLLEGSLVRISWNALGQARAGAFLLERARVPQNADFADSTLAFVPVDSVYAPASDDARFELIDASEAVGRFRYRLLFRAPPFEPTEEAGADVYVPVADHTGIQAVSATPEGVALTLTLQRVRADAHFMLERRTLDFDVFGEAVLGAPVPVSPSQFLARNASPTSASWLDRLPPARRYRYAVRATSMDGLEFQIAESDISVPAPRQAAWVSVYPNPTGGRFTGVFDVPEERTVTFTVFDVLGRSVVGPESQRLAAGRHSRHFDAEGWAPGTYYIVLDTGTSRRVHRLIRVR